VCLDAKESERYEETKESFIRTFEQYGLPETLLCDNGNPWGTAQSVGYTRFEVWLMELGILTKHGRVAHPQTQGKDERFNGTLLKERIRYRAYEDSTYAQRDFDEYRYFYNQERPHHALQLKTPSERYCPSEQRMPQQIEEWSYASNCTVRQIKKTGYLTIGGQGYFLSEAFAGKNVGVMESEEERDVCIVLYRQYRVATVNTQDRIVLARRAALWV
jgi:hypothetical protein